MKPKHWSQLSKDDPQQILCVYPVGRKKTLRVIERLQSTLSLAHARLRGLNGKAKIQCSHNTPYGKGCLRFFPISELTYIQTHWYTHPHGCSGGDYWNQGDGEWDCPHCGHRNRLYKSPEIIKLKEHFKNVVNVHDKD